MTEPALPRRSLRPDILSLLVRSGAMAEARAEIARRTAMEMGRTPEYAALELGYASERDILAAMSEASGVAIWDADAEPAQHGLDLGLNPAFLIANHVVPLSLSGTNVVVALADPFDDRIIESLRFALGRPVALRLAAPGDLRAALNSNESRRFGAEPEHIVETHVARVLDAERPAPAAQALAALLLRAIDCGASDIHIEPRRASAELRLRRDGRLTSPELLDRDLAAAIVGRAKVLAEIDVAETRLPQDGRLTFIARGAPIDIRAATAPTAFGEAVTLRILHRSQELLDLEQLGFEGETLAILNRALARKDGLFIVAGPTGSGKTTTMYAWLNRLAGRGLKILSIEDPIEFQFDHVVQIQAAPQIGLTFASGLRALMRHDPDVLMIGEIRDPDTAAVAVQAALTGHLVLASLHARSLAGIAPRLLDLGVESYQLSAALVGALSQRLVRRLCAACRTRDADGHFDAKGCSACAGTGRGGRIAISDSFEASEAYRQALARGAPVDALARLILDGDQEPLSTDLVRKARDGRVSLREAQAEWL